MTRTLTCDRCHKDTDHLNPVYDDSGDLATDRSIVWEWCDSCVDTYAGYCDMCASTVYRVQMGLHPESYERCCLSCRRPAPTDEGARLRNAMREAIKGLAQYGNHAPDTPDACPVCRALGILSNALEGDAGSPLSKKGDADNANP